MKRMSSLALGAALALLGAGNRLEGQAPDRSAIAAQQSALAKLDWMNGQWRGPAVTQTPGGEHKVIQTERIGPMLDDTIKVLEGKGYNDDGSVGFNAFGVISYDMSTRAYTLHSHAQGRVGDFPLVPTEHGYVWEIAAGPATIRYTASLADGSWHETGDRLIPGRPPQRFFEMTLARIGDTRWPAGDGPKPR
ncbi:DUF1579 domain-containing protein [Sphingomonas sp. 28-63-12]|uniref:DUF1579 domain-containing protein n=1 Tax=Sphingomonas sp. 28-63-12 TaxID=1970434 RepID=UPI0035A947C6